MLVVCHREGLRIAFISVTLCTLIGGLSRVKKKKGNTSKHFLKCVFPLTMQFNGTLKSQVPTRGGDWSSYLRLSSSNMARVQRDFPLFLIHSISAAVQRAQKKNNNNKRKQKEKVSPRCHCLSRWMSPEWLLPGLAADLCSESGRRL